MLAKSKKSACVMAGVASLTYAVTMLFFRLATRYATTRSLPSVQEEFTNVPFSGLIFVILVVILFIVIGMGGLIIHALFHSEIHFGISGLIRWGLFGIIEAVLMKVYPSLFAIQSFAFREFIELIIVTLSYVIVFKIFRLSPHDKKASLS